MSDHNHGESLVAFLFGGIVGAALALLFAPCSGEETRRRLGGWLDENRKKTREFLDEEREVFKHKKDQVQAAWQAGKKAYEDSGKNS
ncbi:MAG: YtxH domain-containing protein [Elusimicrobiota bacterium]